MGSYDTNHDTKPGEGARECSQVIENMVELVGIEPTTSSLRTMRTTLTTENESAQKWREFLELWKYKGPTV